MTPASGQPLRVFLVDDHRLFLSGVRAELAGRADVAIEIVGEAANGFEAVKLAEDLNPELVFLDIQMPKLSGFEVLELSSTTAAGFDRWLAWLAERREEFGREQPPALVE